MKNGAKILGHSVHPILIVFPLGLLATGVVFDIIHLISTNSTFATVAYWMITAGLIGGILAAVFGWIDWFAIPSDTRAKMIGLTHGLINAFVLLLFGLSWYIRSDAPEHPKMIAIALSTIGAVFAAVGGWLGGELVERLGVGVHPGANVNAPSSLSTDTFKVSERSGQKL